MSLGFRIRLGSSSDLPSLGHIDRESGRLFPPGRVPDLDQALPARELQDSLERGLLLVAVCEDACVGFALNEVASGKLHLRQLSVLPEFGRRGIGRALVARAIGICEERGLSGVTLTTFRDLPWNGPFYASMGFREIPRSELEPDLRSHIEREESQGMRNRVAMVYLLRA